MISFRINKKKKKIIQIWLTIIVTGHHHWFPNSSDPNVLPHASNRAIPFLAP